jgi:hypothetical protein
MILIHMPEGMHINANGIETRLFDKLEVRFLKPSLVERCPYPVVADDINPPPKFTILFVSAGMGFK